MMLNLPSRIIVNIIIYNLEYFLDTHFHNINYAVSPIMKHEVQFFNYDTLCTLQLNVSTQKMGGTPAAGGCQFAHTLWRSFPIFIRKLLNFSQSWQIRKTF